MSLAHELDKPQQCHKIALRTTPLLGQHRWGVQKGSPDQAFTDHMRSLLQAPRFPPHAYMHARHSIQGKHLGKHLLHIVSSLQGVMAKGSPGHKSQLIAPLSGAR